MIHGVLHLIGFDDLTEEQKEIMRQKENEYLEIFKNLL
jgi:ssRNA-specific RNase YbeY (16S rRNA maturation enzyme)